MRAYYFDDITGDQRLAHDSGKPVNNAVLASIGVRHWHIPVPATGDHVQVDKVALERGYKNRDVITITKEGLGDLYEAKLKSFYEECVGVAPYILVLTDKSHYRHMHEDEEIRYILEGSGFFDVRGKSHISV